MPNPALTPMPFQGLLGAGGWLEIRKETKGSQAALQGLNKPMVATSHRRPNLSTRFPFLHSHLLGKIPVVILSFPPFFGLFVSSEQILRFKESQQENHT